MDSIKIRQEVISYLTGVVNGTKTWEEKVAFMVALKEGVDLFLAMVQTMADEEKKKADK